MSEFQKIYPFHVDLVKQIYGEDIKIDFLIECIQLEFNIICTKEDIISCIVEEERLDKELTMKNLGF